MWKDKRFAASLLALTTGHLTACAVDDTVPPPLVVRDAAGTSTGAPVGGTSVSSVGASTPSAVGSGSTGSTGSGSLTGMGGSGGSGGTGAGGKAGSAGSAGSGGGAGGAGGRVDGGAGTGGSAGADGATDAGSEAARPDATADSVRPDAVDAADAAVVEACAAETDPQLCARAQKNCGSFVGADNCGVSRRVLACGTCLGAGAVCGAGGTLNVCPGTDPVNRAQGGIVLSSNPTSPPFFATEGDAKAFDNDAATKWYVRGNPTPTIMYDFAGSSAYAITSYTVTSANDAPDRDPVSWRLDGSNSANLATWTPVDTRASQTFAGRGQTNLYSFTNPTGYLVYRFVVTANNGNTSNGGEFQVAEIQLFGTAVVAPPDEAGAGDARASDAADESPAAEGGADASTD